MDPDAVPTCCQLCAHQPLTKYVVPGRTTMWHCAECDLYQNGTLVDQEAYDKSYHAYYLEQQPRKLRTAAVRLNRLAPLLDARAPRLLDIGCSVGCTLTEARRRGWHAVGVDVSEDMVEYGQSQGFDVHLVKGNEVHLPFEDETFDVITAWHVIEHVCDIAQTLNEWKRVLRIGGVLAIETPNVACPKVRLLGKHYRRFWPPEHTYAFSPETLGAFVVRAGYELVPRPAFGQLSDLPPALAVYALGYQAQLAARRVLGINKAFQLFARRGTTARAMIAA